jgi:hypothetical protein
VLRSLASWVALGALLSAVGAARAQLPPADTTPGTPAWIVNRFFDHAGFPDRARYFTAELAARAAAARTPGESNPAGAAGMPRLLQGDSARAVYATAMHYGLDTRMTMDWYTFLIREDGHWKLDGVRRFSVPLIQYILVDSTDAKHARGELLDSLVPVRERMRLGAQPDSVLQSYLLAHEAAFRELAERFVARPDLRVATVDGEGVPDTAKTSEVRPAVTALAVAMRSLLIGAVLRYDDRPGCVFLKIGGNRADNVGFVYAPPACVLPPIMPSFIYVEAMAPRWYVYRTA